MITSAQCMSKFGDPHTNEGSFMTLWDVPKKLEIGMIPKRIYCNMYMPPFLQIAFTNLIKTGCVKELRTWDGCFNIRKKVGGKSLSLHSWGLAIDLNAAWNGYGQKPALSKQFVSCFTLAGFDWGGAWSKPVGMHFQLSSLEL